MAFSSTKRVFMDAYHAVRPIGVSVVATAVVAFVMVGHGWEHLSLVLAGVILLLSAIIIFQVYRAVTGLRKQSSSIKDAAMQAEKHYVSVLQRIMSVMEARDKYSRGRSLRIGKLSEAIARQMKLDDDRCELMNLAGQLHDIGMLAVSEAIVAKQSMLVNKEFRALQRHSEVSYELLKPLESLRDILPAIRYHHERMNGTGYPGGISGDRLPIEARILAVADAFDAMTHDRPTRQAMTSMDAMNELQRCTPAGYDERCVEALARIVYMPQVQEALEAPELQEASC